MREFFYYYYFCLLYYDALTLLLWITHLLNSLSRYDSSFHGTFDDSDRLCQCDCFRLIGHIVLDFIIISIKTGIIFAFFKYFIDPWNKFGNIHVGACELKCLNGTKIWWKNLIKMWKMDFKYLAMDQNNRCPKQPLPWHNTDQIHFLESRS